MSKMDTLSEEQIRNLILGLPYVSQMSIARSMTTIERELSDKPTKRSISIRNELRPGDVGMLIHMHGWIYAEECGYNHHFEGYVCKTFYEFLQNYSPDKDRFYKRRSFIAKIEALSLFFWTRPEIRIRLLACMKKQVLKRNLNMKLNPGGSVSLNRLMSLGSINH
ncbi:hypothetical protein [Paenibacillus sp. PK3_47]|uniref:hypothetical protein n=1 Tax=Paenibacillus sp. PK3_47 TaxID=2072642 RepID=UPI00201E1948|nr:hypothetical protein [Paenibacillus sp. PK3_47]